MKRYSANSTYQIPQLNAYIDSINFFSNAHQSDTKNILFDAAPEGVFELVFQTNDAVWQKNINDDIWKRRDEAFIGGLHQQGYQIKLLPETEVMSVRFKPGAFKYVFAGRLNDFANQKVPLVDIWQKPGLRLYNQLKNLSRHEDKINLVASFIENRLDINKRSAIDESVQDIVSQKGDIDISSLELQSHLSSAQFRKRFREEVGLSPKKYAKIIRINSILNELFSQQPCDLIDLVYAHNYFDQSHFIKDFKSIIGKAPTQYFSELSSSS